MISTKITPDRTGVGHIGGAYKEKNTCLSKTVYPVLANFVLFCYHVSTRPGFFRKKIRIFRKILFFEFFEKQPAKNSKNSKKNNLIFDTI
jgi:hypothetical protein